MGTVWDAPNQQVVRPDSSGPWEEGTGGSAPEAPEVPPDPLDAMTKEQLVAYAAEQGYDIDASATKAEVKAQIVAAGG